MVIEIKLGFGLAAYRIDNGKTKLTLTDR